MEILFTKEFDRVFKKFLLQFSGTHPKWNIFQELLNMGGDISDGEMGFID